MLSLKRAINARQTRVDPNTVIRLAEQGRRNFKIGVANGILAGILDPLSGIFVLTLFLTRLDAPAFLVGLLPTIASCGGLLPQLIVAGKLRGKKRVMAWYTWSSVFRVAGLAGMAISTWLIPLDSGIALTSLFASYLLYMLSSGVSGIPFMEVVGKIVPPHRKGTFFGLRQFGSAVLGIVTSAVAGAVMSEQLGLQFPYNFAVMFTAATIAGAIVFGLWSLVREPDLEHVHRPETGSIFRHGATALQTNRDYRLLTVARLLATFSAIAGPFYLVFASRVLQVPVGTLAIYLIVQTAIPLGAGLLWMPIANKAPRRMLVLITAALQLAVPITALIVAAVAGAGILPSGWNAYIAASIFIVGSLSGSSAMMFNDLVLLSIAPNTERPVYFGFLNTLSGVASLTLPVGGLLLEHMGYTTLFVLSAVLSLCSLLVGLGIERQAGEGRAAARRAIGRVKAQTRLIVAVPRQSVQQLFRREE